MPPPLLSIRSASKTYGSSPALIDAAVIGLDQPKVSALLNGQFRGFSVYRLMAFIAALGRDVEIVMSKTRRRLTKTDETGHIFVR